MKLIEFYLLMLIPSILCQSYSQACRVWAAISSGVLFFKSEGGLECFPFFEMNAGKISLVFWDINLCKALSSTVV